MKLNLKKYVVALMVLATMVSPLANAGIGELAALIKTPVGRFVMLETEEGLFLNRLIMESETATRDVNALVSRLAGAEAASLAGELEARLSVVYQRFRMITAMNSVEVENLLRSLSRETLTLRQLEGQGAAFVRINEYTMQMEARAFGAGEHPGKMAGHDFSSEILSGSKLSNAELSFADMRGVEAVGVDLEGAKLVRADLSGARMVEANLNRAHLTNAALERANLARVRARGTHLSGANLRRANLRGIDLRGADLRGADMTGAIVERSHFRAGFDVQVDGALFDANTKLPFSREDAERLGMVFVE